MADLTKKDVCLWLTFQEYMSNVLFEISQSLRNWFRASPFQTCYRMPHRRVWDPLGPREPTGPFQTGQTTVGRTTSDTVPGKTYDFQLCSNSLQHEAILLVVARSLYSSGGEAGDRLPGTLGRRCRDAQRSSRQ